MSPSELIEIGERLFGPQWRKPLADALGVDVATLRRWATARVAVPRVAALAIRLLADRREAKEEQ